MPGVGLKKRKVKEASFGCSEFWSQSGLRDVRVLSLTATVRLCDLMLVWFHGLRWKPEQYLLPLNARRVCWMRNVQWGWSWSPAIQTVVSGVMKTQNAEPKIRCFLGTGIKSNSLIIDFHHLFSQNLNVSYQWLEINLLVLGNGPFLMGHQHKGMLVIVETAVKVHR